jgi:GTPase-activator protein for Ras-like GTPase/IPT/TIG domain
MRERVLVLVLAAAVAAGPAMAFKIALAATSDSSAGAAGSAGTGCSWNNPQNGRSGTGTSSDTTKLESGNCGNRRTELLSLTNFGALSVMPESTIDGVQFDVHLGFKGGDRNCPTQLLVANVLGCGADGANLLASSPLDLSDGNTGPSQPNMVGSPTSGDFGGQLGALTPSAVTSAAFGVRFQIEAASGCNDGPEMQCFYARAVVSSSLEVTMSNAAPLSSKTAGGGTLTVTGTNFVDHSGFSGVTYVPECRFGSEPAVAATVASPTRLTCPIPAMPTSMATQGGGEVSFEISLGGGILSSTGSRFSWADCPQDCNSAGTCVFNSSIPGPQCQCVANRAGVACETILCPAMQNCNGHGVCTGPTSCQCAGGWSGATCTTAPSGGNATGTNTASSGSSAEKNSDTGTEGSDATGVIVAVVLVAVCALLVAVAGILLFLRSKRQTTATRSFVPPDWETAVFGDYEELGWAGPWATDSLDSGVYGEIVTALTESDCRLARTLLDNTQESLDVIAPDLVSGLGVSSLDFVCAVLASEIGSVASQSDRKTVLRGDSAGSKLWSFLVRLAGTRFRWAVLGDWITQLAVAAENELGDDMDEESDLRGSSSSPLKSLAALDVELDTERLAAEIGQEEQLLRKYALLTSAQQIVVLLREKAPQFPSVLRAVLARVADATSDVGEATTHSALANLVFLRFIVPTIFAPMGFGLLDPSTRLGAQVSRKLVLVSKLLQALANNVKIDSGGKEAFMSQLQDFIDSNRDVMEDMLQDFAAPEGTSDDEEARNLAGLVPDWAAKRALGRLYLELIALQTTLADGDEETMSAIARLRDTVGEPGD